MLQRDLGGAARRTWCKCPYGSPNPIWHILGAYYYKRRNPYLDLTAYLRHECKLAKLATPEVESLLCLHLLAHRS